jgi:hypothetical protein
MHIVPCIARKVELRITPRFTLLRVLPPECGMVSARDGAYAGLELKPCSGGTQ